LLSVLAVCLYGLVRWPRSRRPIALGLVVAVLVQIPGRTVLIDWPTPGWLVVACDVGQGDAIVLAAGRGEAVVIDAGPEPVSVDRCLRGLGVRRIPLLVLSHFHADHIAGLGGVLRGRDVGTVLVSPDGEPAFGSGAVARQLGSRGLLAQTPHVGDVFVAGTGSQQVRLSVIAPRHVFHGSHSDPNNSSIVLLALTHGRRILLTGDAEVEDQQEILASGADVRADILKVPHHGSAFSDPSFLSAVHAQVGLISSGRGNVYGHPAASLIDRLRTLGVRTARTDELGDIAVVLAGNRLVVASRHPDMG
jgi:competence protein ComEC